MAASNSNSLMRQVAVIVFFLTSLACAGQTATPRTYRDGLGSTLTLRFDGIFEYWWGIQYPSSWTKGSWRKVRDTIYLEIAPVYDTLPGIGLNGKAEDLLVLSHDRKPNRRADYTDYFPGDIEQNRYLPPKVLLIRKEQLYPVAGVGTRGKRRERNVLTGRMAPTMYVQVRTP